MKNQNQDYLISVIVPVFNSERYLEKCVDSILNQTYYNLEIILVDDGSNDKSPSICDLYAVKDERVQAVHKSQGGVCDARNCGIEIATGNYLTFVDNDDFILPDMYETLLTNMLNYQVEISMCSYNLYFEECGEERNEIKLYTKKMDSLEALHVFHTEERIDMIVPWNKLYKKELFDGIRYPVGRTFDDEFVTYKLLWKARDICYTNQKFYFFRQRMDSITHTLTFQKFTDYLDALIERHDYFRVTVKNNELLEEDTFFCMKELINIHFRECPQKQLSFYHSQFLNMYKACTLKKQLIIGERMKYFAAARFPTLLRWIWKIKKKKRGIINGGVYT